MLGILSLFSHERERERERERLCSLCSVFNIYENSFKKYLLINVVDIVFLVNLLRLDSFIVRSLVRLQTQISICHSMHKFSYT